MNYPSVLKTLFSRASFAGGGTMDGAMAPTTETSGKPFARAMQYFFLLLVFLLPLWALPLTQFPVLLNKSLLIYLIIIVGGVLWLVSVMKNGFVRVYGNTLFLALVALLAVNGFSLLFSQAPQTSFFGTGVETGTFSALLLFGFSLFLAVVAFHNERAVARWFTAIFLSAFALFLFQFFWSGFGIKLLPFRFLNAPNDTLIGSWNELGVFFGFVSLMGLALFEFLSKGLLRACALLTFIAGFIGLVFVNFSLVWWIYAVLAGVFMVYRLVALKDIRAFFGLPFFTMLAALFFIITSSFTGDVLNAMGLSNVAVRPSWASTIAIGREAIRAHPIVGTGPETFVYNWIRYRPANINQTPFWATPFTAGVGTIPSLALTTGLLGVLAWLVFLALFLWTGVKSIFRKREEGGVDALLVAAFLGSLYLWTASVFYAINFFLFFLAFFTTGIMVAMVIRRSHAAALTFSFMQNTVAGFVAALAVMFFMILGLASLYFVGRSYFSAALFAKGLDAFNNNGDTVRAEALLTRARSLNDQEAYARAMTEINILQLRQMLQEANFSSDEFRARFQNLLSTTIRNANAARDLNPADPQNWSLLGRVYELVLPLRISGADEFASNAYRQAADLAPSDPTARLALARVAIARGDLAGAKSLLQETVALKSDFAAAQFLLAQLAAQEGNLTEAIRRTEATALLAPNDIGVLFQLGLLYYQNNDLNSAQNVFERIVAASPNYSNARYFLGLIYDRARRTDDAIAQFNEIERFNPDNAEVKRILNNLQSGKPALIGISPPAPSPEDRTSVPVSGQ